MKEVTAMPSLCDVTTFGLENEAFNRKSGLEWLKRNPRIVEELPHSTLYRCGDAQNGFFFLWEPNDRLVEYFIRYETKKTKLHGLSVTQTALWRSLTSRDNRGLTRHVIFDMLLPQYKSLLSDQIQTADGKRFWIDLMSESLGKDLNVYLIDFLSQKIHRITQPAELRLLGADENEATSVWFPNSNRHRGLRFMISNEPAKESE
jgi:hypothetical protein